MAQTIEVRFKGTRRGFFHWTDKEDNPRLNDAVIVEVERGKDLGHISAVGEVALKKCGTACNGCPSSRAPSKSDKPKAIIRRASSNEVNTAVHLRRSEEEVRRKVLERVKHHGLAMKVSDTEWQWDRNKLTVFFTAEQRVDFRMLVRDLAALFRTRIDLRQIGVRDEAARLSGVGRCGREYCCSSWLTELSPVSLSLAKDQHLALNPAQISGGCGRLLCCLKYEHDFYVTSRKRFPKEGKTLQTALGEERVVSVDILRERVSLRGPDGASRIIPLLQLREEIASIPRSPAIPDTAHQDPAGAPQPEAQAETPAPEEKPPVEGEPPSDPAAARTQRRRRGRRRRRKPGDSTNPEG
ncbi:MAG: regulatory iron-sulfur-containing complex subunit RicT [Gemmatimonadales bacterium]